MKPWKNSTSINTTVVQSPQLQSLPTAGSGALQPFTPIVKRKTDPNLTDSRLLANRRCIYERRLPGDAYITAHVERLQHGYFSSPNVSDADYDNVDFVAINFVFHPSDCQNHRFKAATIRATIQNQLDGSFIKDGELEYPYPQENPRFLMHAPHLIYGAVSPETLQWNFSLAGSLGVSEAPVAASLSPSGGLRGQYKLYEMMKIQGSVRTLISPYGPEFHVEDGEVVWSMTENVLQRSGLPREFTFVFLVLKPYWDSRLRFTLDIDPVIDAWFGKFPNWWLGLSQYQPLTKRPVNFRHEIGQRFEPVKSSRGFNFATLASSFDDYVNMPGSTYSSNVSPEGVVNDPTGTGGHTRLGSSGGQHNITTHPGSTYPSSPTNGQNPYQSGYYPPGSYPWLQQQQQGHGHQQQERHGAWAKTASTPGHPIEPSPSSPGNMNQPIRSMGQALISSTLDANTLNIRVLLDSGISSHLPSALQAERNRTLSPRAISPTLMMGRAKSLRRSRSREGLNRASSVNVRRERIPEKSELNGVDVDLDANANANAQPNDLRTPNTNTNTNGLTNELRPSPSSKGSGNRNRYSYPYG